MSRPPHTSLLLSITLLLLFTNYILARDVPGSTQDLQSSTITDEPTSQAFSTFCKGNCKSTTTIKTSGSVTLQGRGFHRSLHYDLAFERPSKWRKQLLLGAAVATARQHSNEQNTTCNAIVIQPIPRNAFVDIYQLQNIARLKRGPPVEQFGEIELESIAMFAPTAAAAIFINVTFSNNNNDDVSGIASSSTHIAKTQFKMPIHGRYPDPVFPNTTNTWADVLLSVMVEFDLPPPHILFRCKELSMSTYQLISQPSLNVSTTWSLPAGNMLHANFTRVFSTIAILTISISITLRVAWSHGYLDTSILFLQRYLPGFLFIGSGGGGDSSFSGAVSVGGIGGGVDSGIHEPLLVQGGGGGGSGSGLGLLVGGGSSISLHRHHSQQQQAIQNHLERSSSTGLVDSVIYNSTDNDRTTAGTSLRPTTTMDTATTDVDDGVNAGDVVVGQQQSKKARRRRNRNKNSSINSKK